jgi:hypothetical protein
VFQGRHNVQIERIGLLNLGRTKKARPSLTGLALSGERGQTYICYQTRDSVQNPATRKGILQPKSRLKILRHLSLAQLASDPKLSRGRVYPISGTYYPASFDCSGRRRISPSRRRSPYRQVVRRHHISQRSIVRRSGLYLFA